MPLPRPPGSIILISTLLAATACAEEPTPSPPPEPGLGAEEAARLIDARFPDADVSVESARLDGDQAIVVATFNGSEMEFILAPSTVDAEGWALVGVEAEHMSGRAAVEDLEGISETMVDMKELAGALGDYRTSNGRYPDGSGVEALATLVPEYLPEGTHFTDAWMQEYRYSTSPEGTSYTLTSPGPDGTLATEDDLVLHEGEFLRREPG